MDQNEYELTRTYFSLSFDSTRTHFGMPESHQARDVAPLRKPIQFSYCIQLVQPKKKCPDKIHVK